MVACVILASMSNAETGRRCLDPDVDSSWWLEPDFDPSDFGMTSSRRPSVDTEYGKALQVARQNQARAKLHCYECPLLADCRSASWDEPAHVWGGLDANERYAARQKGRVPIGSQYVYKSAQNSNKQRAKVVGLFLEGASVDELAATLDCNSEQIWYHVKGALASVRVAREEPLWIQTTPPALPGNVARSSFRLGALTSLDWAFHRGADSSSDSEARAQTAA